MISRVRWPQWVDMYNRGRCASSSLLAESDQIGVWPAILGSTYFQLAWSAFFNHGDPIAPVTS
jgi:hypothetical protein